MTETLIRNSDNLGRAIRWINGAKSAAIVYNDPMPKHPLGTGSGSVVFYADNSPQNTEIPLSKNAHERRMSLLRLLSQKTLCERLYVWDLHSFMLRAYIPTAGIKKLQSNIVDLSFLMAWTGRQDMSQEELLDCYKVQSLAALGDKLMRELPSDAMRYHNDYWKPMLLSFVPREMKPIEVVGTDGIRRSQYVHYVFAQGVTSRISARGGNFSNDSDFFGVHNFPKSQRARTIVAREGWKIVWIDMKSADVRTIASLARDKQLMGCLSDGKCPYKQVSEEVNLGSITRDVAKRLTLAFFYGGVPSQLAKRENVSSADASKTYAVAHKLYGATIKWAEDVAKDKEGFTRTGRLFWAGKASEARRKLPNHITQSTTADICNSIYATYLHKCSTRPNRSIPILFLHDEFVFEVNEMYLEEEIEFLREIGETNPLISFGLEDLDLRVNIKYGDSWRDG